MRNDENLQAIADYARFRMLQARITGFATLAMLALTYWFLARP